MLMLPLCGGARRADAFGGFGRRLKRAAPLLAAPAALLLSQGQAKAVLTYNIFELGGNFVLQASGSLDLNGATSNGTFNCGDPSLSSLSFDSSLGLACTGTAKVVPLFDLTGPSNFEGSASLSASSVSGITTGLFALGSVLGLDSDYISGTPIVSSATFNANGQTLAGLGITTVGLLGTWTINGTSQTIQLFAGPPATSVPGPLPLLGAGAAFGWSRRLRKRISASVITPPQA